jgi:hypothetical protein
MMEQHKTLGIQNLCPASTSHDFFLLLKITQNPIVFALAWVTSMINQFKKGKTQVHVTACPTSHQSQGTVTWHIASAIHMRD